MYVSIFALSRFWYSVLIMVNPAVVVNSFSSFSESSAGQSDKGVFNANTDTICVHLDFVDNSLILGSYFDIFSLSLSCL